MSQSSTLSIGMDVHKDTIAVADVAKAHDAEVAFLGTLGTRHCDLTQLLRTMHSQAKHLIFVYEAGSCGYWLYRDLTKKGYECWGGAPSVIPNKPGDRVQTDRRDGVPLARLISSEYTSAERRRQGSITNAWNTHARRGLVEGAWAYRDSAKVSRHLPRRLEKQPKIIQDIRV